MHERSERGGRRFDWVLLIAAVLVIPVVAIEESGTGESLGRIADVTNWVMIRDRLPRLEDTIKRLQHG